VVDLPSPEPLDVDAVRVVTVGTILWAVAGLVLLPFHVHGWVLWMCAAGFGLGLLGIGFCRRRRGGNPQPQRSRQ
jgi:hypothetical protein